jgi:hypothetical protein
MKKVLVLLLIGFTFQFNYSQETYTVDGETLPLKIEISGQLDLLWTNFENNYRFFVRTDNGAITELKNTIDADENYKEEFKTTLSKVTNGLSADKLKFLLSSLRKYIDKYNTSVDPTYKSPSTGGKAQLRLGFSGGVTNNPFVRNPDNVKAPLIGAELEIFEASDRPRHAGFFQFRHAFETNDLSYSATEFSLGYRFRIINKSSFSIYAQVKFATLNFTDVTVTDENDMETNLNVSTFDVPFIFGIGSDIKVGENSYITIIYGELFALLLDNQDNFSTDIAIGYKFNL